MSFMKSLAKPLLQAGASFIPGVGPAASALIGGIGGSALSALGGSGKQGETRSNSTQTMSGTSNDTQDINTFQEAVESPYFSQFREGLVPQFNQEMTRLQQPIFGDAQKAQFVGDLNKLAKSAMGSLQSSLARTGGLDSGRLGAGLSDIETGRMSEATRFFSQLPFQEEQARRAGVGGLLGAGMQWAEAAPISQRNTGTVSSNRSFNQSGTSQGTNEMYGPGFGRSLASGLGELGGGLFADLLKKGFKG